jgi:hypothetical protein
MDGVRRYKIHPGATPEAPGAARHLAQVVDQARFQAYSPDQFLTFASLPVPCTAVVIACFREDSHILMLQPQGEAAPWDLPHGALPHGEEPISYAGRLLCDLAGVTTAQPLSLYGAIDWGATATAGGWGWTACLFGGVAEIGTLPKTSWAARRAFLPLGEAQARSPGDLWVHLRQQTLESAAAAFDTTRDYWLLQTLDAISLNDLNDTLE